MEKKTKIFFGSNLKTLRTKQKKNQGDIAKMLAMKQTVLSNYETGYSFPDFKTLIRIIELFGIDAHDLLFKDLSKSDEKSGVFEAKNTDKDEIIALQKEVIASLKEKLASYENATSKRKAA